MFALAGRGHRRTSSSIRRAANWATANFAITDKAAHVCPVGAILIKRVGFAEPIGERRYDREPISAEADALRHSGELR